jgi:general secretion pathway protein H
MRHLQRAFTLIELLVAVVIVAIILSVTVLSIGLVGDDREVQTEARRLMSLLEVSQDEAMMQGREFGIEFLRQGYRFVEYDPIANLWVEQIEDETFRYRALPEGVEIELYLEDRQVALEMEPVILERPQEDRDDEDDDNDERQFGRNEYQPHLFIYSSGDMSAFELRLVRQQDRATVAMSGDLLGNIEFINLDDDYLRN